MLAVLGVFIGSFSFAASGNGSWFSSLFARSAPQFETVSPQVAPQRQSASQPAEPLVVPSSGNEAGAPPAKPIVLAPEPETVSPAASTPLPKFTLLQGLRHEYQGWNNCAPSSLGMVLSYYGRAETQKDVAPLLKSDPKDKNVSPHEFTAYVKSIGFQAHVGVGGDLDLLKRILSAGFPVIVEFWFEPEPNDGMGHYRVLYGYDDQSKVFHAHDSYVGPSVTVSYTELDSEWQVFNRTYVVIYPSESQAAVETVLTESNRGRQMWERALHVAQQELSQDENNAFAWFNLGTNALQLGDTHLAAQAFDWARHLGLPWRMLWYQFGPFEAYWVQGRYDDVIALANSHLGESSSEEWHYWRGRAREMTGDLAGARSDFIAAIELNANFLAAREALEKSQAA
ncbi:MAG: C39 family peptidase [Chloroflexi bacterium]|nr:C39 family peptidase [Chloroflexota bacterium]